MIVIYCQISNLLLKSERLAQHCLEQTNSINYLISKQQSWIKLFS